MSSASSSSSSPPQSPEPEDRKLVKSQGTGKKQRIGAPSGEGVNEGEDPHWAYKPPEGAVLIDHSFDNGEFDWEAIEKDPDVELWLFRVPEEVKLKYLEKAEIVLPHSQPQDIRVGHLTKGSTTYDIWSLGHGKDVDDQCPGQEIKHLSCVVPHRQKKKLMCPSKPVTRRLVLSARAVDSAAPQEDISNILQNPPRHSYPSELLTHRFIPTGAIDPDHEMEEDATAPMNLTSVEEAEATADSQDKSSRKDKDKKVKKRKGEESNSPKKTKKVKTAS